MEKIRYHMVQHILLPEQDAEDAALYFSGCDGAAVNTEKEALTVPPGAVLNGATYFNSIEVERYYRYTGTDNFTCTLKIAGHATVTLVNQYYIKKKLHTKNVVSQTTGLESGNKSVELTLNAPEVKHGILFFTIQAHSEAVLLYGGYYSAGMDSRRKVREITLSIVFCTYKREQYVRKNVQKIDAWLAHSPRLYENVDILVVDNGQTLTREDFSASSHIRLYHNRNTGGSGGFARGMMEILNSGSRSHILLMDDDVEVVVESFFRTVSLLEIIKDEFTDSILAGAMFRTDNKHIQYEEAALWRGSGLTPLSYMLDMSNPLNLHEGYRRDCLQNSRYAGWWYCVIPVTQVSKNSLPFPFFIRRDDVEFSLRSGAAIISFHGIMVYHDPFDLKKNHVADYYLDVRNDFIMNALYKPFLTGLLHSLKLLVIQCMKQIFLYDYKSIAMLREACNDFFRVSHIWESDPVDHIQRVSRFQELTQTYAEAGLTDDEVSSALQSVRPAGKIKRILSLLTLNGHLVPVNPKGSVIVPIDRVRMYAHWFMNKKMYCIDRFNERVVIRYFSRVRCAVNIVSCLLLSFRTILYYNRSRKMLRKNYHYLISEKFWKKYLEIS